MACWVAPTVAAEYWNVPVEQVLERIARGEIPSKSLGSFTLVDIHPHTPEPGGNATLSRAEVKVLVGGAEELAAAQSAAYGADAVLDEIEQAALRDAGDWRAARKMSGAKRRAPARKAG
jgi:hypothetical protein